MANANKRADGRGHPGAMGVFAALACLGGWFAIEAWGKSLALYQFAALAAGVGLTLPLWLALIFGNRWIALAKRLGVAIASVVVATCLLEWWVRATEDPRFFEARLRVDAVLGHAFEPSVGEVDAWGFRNPRVPDSVDIVCLGDSQTWGTNIGATQAWPAALGERANATTYNMGIGGFGPLHFLGLVDRVQELAPKAVVVGLYLGNDVADAHRHASLDHWSDYRDPAEDYPDPATFTTFQEDKPSPNHFFAIVDGVMERSRLLWGLMRGIKEQLRTSSYLADVYWKEEGAPRYTEGALATHFTPGYRVEAVNTARAEIRDGLRITDRAFRELTTQLNTSGAQVAVLLIHTKEFYYQRFLQSRGETAGEAMAELMELESELERKLLERAQGWGTRWIDPTPEVLQALEKGKPLWPASSDGHLDEAGSALFAAVALRELADWL